jgi:hypothetical protein
MTFNRRYILKAGTGLALAGLTAESVRAASDRYTLDSGRGAFAFFESRDGKDRTHTAVFITRSAGSGPDGSLRKPVALVWTTTWNHNKNKIRRVSFGVADDGRAKVNVASDYTTAAVSGSIRVFDPVKNETTSLKLNLSWSHKNSKSSLNFNESYYPAPDQAYTARYVIKGSARDAVAKGSVMRGNTDLTPKSSSDGFIGDFDSTRVTFSYP